MRVQVIAKLDDDVSTDEIYPGRFMATVLPAETPRHAFADMTELNSRLTSGGVPRDGVILAGKNFGCGSSREQAASALQGHGLVVIACGFARIFLQNAINVGLRTITSPAIEASEGDELEISETAVTNMSSGKSFPITPLPAAQRAIVAAGGLIPYTKELLKEKLLESASP